MAETQNGAAPAGNGQAPGSPQPGGREVIINVQYVKDLSFENPRAPHSLLQTQQQQPEVQVGVDVKAQNIAPNFYEVALTIHAEAKAANERVFLVEVVYCAVVTLNNVAEADLGRALLIETPRLLFPFARAIIANATRDGGFMPLLLHPIDFAEVVRQQQAAATAAKPATVA